jgi:hypothetical protein
MNEELDRNEWEEQDVDRVVEALRAAWKTVPSCTLSEVLDAATPAPFCDLSSDELVEALNEFTLQNM